MDRSNWNNKKVLQIKAQVGDELRRFTLPEDATFDTLVEKLQGVCGFPFTLRYKDDEGDLVTMTSTQDLTMALHISGENALLRLVVLPSAPSAASERFPSFENAREKKWKGRRHHTHCGSHECPGISSAKPLVISGGSEVLGFSGPPAAPANHSPTTDGCEPISSFTSSHDGSRCHEDGSKRADFKQRLRILREDVRREIGAARASYNSADATWDTRRLFWTQIQDIQARFRQAKAALKKEIFEGSDAPSSSDSDSELGGRRRRGRWAWSRPIGVHGQNPTHQSSPASGEKPIQHEASPAHQGCDKPWMRWKKHRGFTGPQESDDQTVKSDIPPMRERKLIVKASREEFARKKAQLRRDSARMSDSELRTAKIEVLRAKMELIRSQLQATEETLKDLESKQ